MINLLHAVGESLQNLDIYIGNTLAKGNFSDHGYTHCGNYSSVASVREWIKIICNQTIKGKFVAVQAHGASTHLTICELSVHRDHGKDIVQLFQLTKGALLTIMCTCIIPGNIS